jgi:2-oxoglutarate ferredoxin oxidoreductase subunit beta
MLQPPPSTTAPLVEIYQNCNIFNDDAFEPLKDPTTRDDFCIRLSTTAHPVGANSVRRRPLAGASRWWSTY